MTPPLFNKHAKRLQVQRCGKHNISLNQLRSCLEFLCLHLVSHRHQCCLHLLDQLVYSSNDPFFLPNLRMHRVIVPSKIVVILQISTNFAPLAHSYIISIIVGLYCDTKSSTSTVSLHSLHTVATRLAVSWSLPYAFAISGRGLIVSSDYVKVRSYSYLFQKHQ